MNQEYKNMNGTIIIATDKGLQERKNEENIERILETENQIEILENTLKDTQESLKACETEKKLKSSIKVDIIASIILIVSIWIFPTIFANLLDGNFSIDSIFKITELGMSCTIAASPFGTIFAGLFTFQNINRTLKNLKNRKNLEETTAYLEKEITKSKEKLAEYQKEETFNKITDEDIHNLNDTNEQYREDLNRRLNLLEKIIMMRKKFEKYYQKGELKQKLAQYSNSDIEFAQNFIIKNSKGKSRKRINK